MLFTYGDIKRKRRNELRDYKGRKKKKRIFSESVYKIYLVVGYLMTSMPHHVTN